MKTTALTHFMRRRFVLAVSAVLMLGVAVAITAAAVGSGGAKAPGGSPPRYQDYLSGGSGNQSADPCAQPVSARTGGWICPATGGGR